MKITLTTKLFAGFVLLLALFSVVVLFYYQLAGQVVQNARKVEASQRISNNASTLLRNIIDMETGFRGYLLIGNEQTLAPYYEGERQLIGRFAQLRALVTESPDQVELIDQTQRLFQQWTGYSHLLVVEKREARRRNVRQSGLEGLPHRRLTEGLTGKQVMDNIRERLAAFERREAIIRQQLRQRLDDSIGRAQWLSAGLAAAALILGLLWAVYIVRVFARRLRSMLDLARRMADGDYNSQIVDTEQDEVSELTSALNVMARTVGANISQLESRNQELDQFAYVVSHDLKAPLRGIESASRWIEEDMGKDALPEHIREFLGMMRQRVHRMEKLITGILDLARVGRVAQANETVFVRSLLREVIDSLNPPPGFKVELPFFLPTLTTNAVQLQQVFANLISNALKYHDHPESGTVHIGCDDAGEFYLFSVADDGPGIDPDYHDRIFVIFQTLTERDTLESTGVGLAIVKKIVERQGGRIGVKSAEGQGAKFIFTWPKHPPKAKPTAPAMAAVPHSAVPLPN
ncbi:CHASE3 domain-containing protein [Hymenobacter sp. BT770]|uniref:sensor histidine kinase n=1 Tax=Hymenobacter sp. BT770 TaxID=2886942 RepID=UPI001D0FDB3A|nr:ATP-binding protein [Hymenobacter sp. BT770]MCC3152626.1 CHASE3 domain-containing protein [Hymenobacter sp. BT770]MDO3414699.1 CHASE3 domain-containing protein [Hymenobacter sp. BT770]